MNRVLIALASVLGMVCCVLGMAASAASAHQLAPYEYASHFDGTGSSAGAFSSSIASLTIDQENGRVFAMDRSTAGQTLISQFDLSGQPVPFSALSGSSTISAGGEWGFERNAIQFDWTPFHGGIYTIDQSGLRAYNPDGSLRFGVEGVSGAGASDAAPIVPDGSLVYTPGTPFFTVHQATNGAQGQGSFFSGGEISKLELGSDGYYYYLGNFFSQGLFKAKKLSECEEESFTCQIVGHFSYKPARDLALDRSTGDIYVVEQPYDRVTEYSSEGQPLNTFGLPEGAFAGLSEARGIAVDETTKDVYVTSLDGTPRIDVFHHGAPVTVPDVTTLPADHPDDTSAILKGTVNADGVDTTACKVEWGPTTQYTNTLATEGVECEQGNVLTGSGDHLVTLKVESLTVGGRYHYRVAAKNANGYWTYGVDRLFEGSTAPTSPAVLVDQVNTDGARFTAEVNPHGGTTSYHFEIGTQDCSANPCQIVPVPDKRLRTNVGVQSATAAIQGLEPDTTYYVRLVASNGAGSASPSAVFHTFPGPPTEDPCTNAQVRQQTSAYLLPDCRAYELVSARNAGGYDVESSLVPGETPFSSYPGAPDRVLYGLHFGSVPGISGNPTNDGLDPYVAERHANGWITRYVGLPSNGMADTNAFGSPLLAADEGLEVFAFGGIDICEPCFTGKGTNLPVRIREAAAIPGMAGSQEPGPAAPEGEIDRYLSADGSHLVFGSTKKFEAEGGENSLTIYERDLEGAPPATEVVSRDENGTVFSGAGTAELDVSGDGSRVVVGKLLSTDAAGNHYYHLYLHLAGIRQSADLTPGAVNGALFDGMSADGSKVFFTTVDHLLPADDTDESADIYEADVDSGAAVSRRLVTTDSAGAPSNADGCAPPGYPHSWNAPAGEGKCNAVAPAGGAGVAGNSGAFYFVSPELLEPGKGEAGQANLYFVAPAGAPRFVGTIDSSAVKPGQPPAEHPLIRATFASAPEAEALAVDEANGDVYVIRQADGKVARFDSTGTAKEFTATGSNTIGGFTFAPLASGLAIDNATGSPLAGDLYVASGGAVTIWGQNGEKLGQLDGSGSNKGSLENACGVAVDSLGTVYVSDRAGYVWKYTPKPPSGELTDADYTVTGIQTPGFTPCGMAADGDGHLYVSGYPDGPLKRFNVSAFTGGTPAGQAGSTITAISKGISTDQQTHEVFVSEGNQVAVFTEGGERLSTIQGTGAFSGSRGVAVRSSNKHLFVSSKSAGTISEFGSQSAPYQPIDNPAVVHGVQRANEFSYEDFQVSPDGRFAAFSTVVPLTGYTNLGHPEIIRYDSQTGDLSCASCASTLAPASSGASLSRYGLNLSEDGRVFFTTDEGLVLSDTNERSDAYEWHDGTIGALSSGQSPTDSALLGVSEDGKDAFFFTRDVLVTDDENGKAVKIYDAREGGGFLKLPTPQECAASDECHGAGTRVPPPPNINSLEGPGGSGYGPPQRTRRCKKGFVRRHGHCVKKRHRHRKRRKHHG